MIDFLLMTPADSEVLVDEIWQAAFADTRIYAELQVGARCAFAGSAIEIR